MRSIRGRGPYQILGHSFGGWVAYEMALQLQAEGEEVSALFVVDSRVPHEAGDIRNTHVDSMLQLVQLYEMNLESSLGIEREELELLTHERQLALLLSRLIRSGMLPPRTKADMLQGVVRVFETNFNTRYRPSGAFAGAFHLIGATSPSGDGNLHRAADATFSGWLGYSPQAICWEAPGNHMTLLAQPNVAALAKWIQRGLRA